VETGYVMPESKRRWKDDSMGQRPFSKNGVALVGKTSASYGLRRGLQTNCKVRGDEISER